MVSTRRPHPEHALRETSVGANTTPLARNTTPSGPRDVCHTLVLAAGGQRDAERAHLGAPGSQGTREEGRSWQGEVQAQGAWQARAGTIGDGSAARLRWRSIVRLTAAGVMAAMMRRVPRPHAGQRAMSKAKTRFSSRAQLQGGEAQAAGASPPCWRGVGVMDPRS
jgi:hypothetical protein